MTDHEKKIIDNSIEACQSMIKYLEKQIKTLEAKKVSLCCFDKKKIERIKIKRRK
jgi:hypothetical protein